MYFYDVQGFYNKSKCIEGFMNRFNFSNSQPPAQQPAQPPAQQPVQQTDLFGVNTSISPPPEEQPAQPPAQPPAQQTASQETSTTSSTTSQIQTNSSQSQIPLINLNPPIQQASNQNLNNSILSGYVTNLVSSRFNELNKSNEDTNRIVNIKIFTLKDPEVFIINDETKANSYNEESSKIFRIFYKPKLEKSKILIEISSYYDINGTHDDKFECEINVSEDKNHYTNTKGGKRIAIRKIRFEKQIGGGARTGSFFPSGIFKNNNTKPKYFHFNVKREGSDDRFRLARGKNSKFLEVEGLIKIIEIKD